MTPFASVLPRPRVTAAAILAAVAGVAVAVALLVPTPHCHRHRGIHRPPSTQCIHIIDHGRVIISGCTTEPSVAIVVDGRFADPPPGCRYQTAPHHEWHGGQWHGGHGYSGHGHGHGVRR